MGIATGTAIALGVGALAAGATAYSASEAADAQEEANEQNAANAAATNDKNYQQFLESRGESGTAVLPRYLRAPKNTLTAGQRQALIQAGLNPRDYDGTGFFEEKLGRDLMALYEATGGGGDYQAQVDANREALQGYADMQRGARDAVGGIFNGQLGNRLRANLAPVQGARLDAANVNRAAQLEALSATLNEIQAKSRSRGFTGGDSFGKNMLNFNARRIIGGSAADMISNAKLANAMDSRMLEDNVTMLPVTNASLPYSLGQQEVNQLNLPENMALDQQARRLQPFNFLRIGQNQFQYSPLPQVQPVASTGQIVGQSLGQFAGFAGGALQDEYAAKGMSGAGTSTGTGLKKTTAPSPTYFNPNSYGGGFI